jgi:hypothetical protein
MIANSAIGLAKLVVWQKLSQSSCLPAFLSKIDSNTDNIPPPMLS